MVELFIEGPKGDEFFESLKKSTRLFHRRDLIEAQWQQYKIFCGDPDNFRNLFRNSFVAMHWEIYVFNVLRDHDYKLIKVDGHGPDILVEDERGKIWIECVAPNAGSPPNGISFQRTKSGLTRARQWSECSYKLRYAQAIASKIEKFAEYICDGIVTPADRCVIAVSGGALPDADWEDDIPIVTKMFFGIGKEYATIDSESGDLLEGGYHQEDDVGKQNGSKVGTALVYTDAFRPIAGVLHSTRSWAAPDTSGGDLHFTHNPACTNPIALSTFGFGWERWVDREIFRDGEHASLITKSHRHSQ